MKAKEYIIQKLVNLGKKHRWMKYPMLAVVSLISLIFLALEKCMERPRRAVIALVCLVLIISQSWYLISVANDPEYPESAGNVEGIVTYDEASDSSDPTSSEETPTGEQYVLWFFDDAGIGTTFSSTVTVYADKEGHFTLDGSRTEIQTLTPDDSDNKNYSQYYRFDGWYNGSTKVTSTTDLTTGMADRQKRILLYAKWDRIAYKITYAAGEGMGASWNDKVDIGGSVEIKSTTDGSFSFTKTGYTASSEMWIVASPKKDTLYPGQMISFEEIQNKYNNDIILVPEWIPNHYTIHFSKGDPDEEPYVTGEMDDLEAVYDEAVLIPECGYKRQGYVFVGWEAPDKTIVQPGLIEKNFATSGECTLKAKWVYREGELTPDELNYQYRDEVHQVIEAYHQGIGGGDFTVEVLGVSGKTIDGEITSYDDFKTLTGLQIFGEGIDSTVGNSIIVNGMVKTVSEGAIVLKLKLHDNHNNKDTYPELKIYLNRRELRITGIETPEKVYDGTTQISIGTIYFENETGANIYLNNGTQGGFFADPNVGEDKDIVIHDIYVYDRDGSDTAKYYTVASPVTISGGKITPRSVEVTTVPVYANGQDHILAGQTPEFTVEVKEEDLPEAVAEADLKVILTAILKDQKNFTCTYGAPYYQPGNYYIGINSQNVSLLNYSLVVKEGTLKVVQDSISDYDYRIEGSIYPGNQWYYDVEPKVIAYSSVYDRVYVYLNDSDKKYTYDSAFKEAAPVSEELAKDGRVYIQLGKSDGAVTAPKEISIHVDITAPKIEVDNIEITTVNAGSMSKVGNFLSFGNFFKEAIVITIPVSDNLSGPNSLTYYLEGEYLGNGITVPISNGKASISLAPKYKGTIALVVTDQAGNSSTKADMIGVEGSNCWVVENQAPEVRVTATDSEGNPAYSNEDLYYKFVTVTASVADPDAGVAYLEWNVTKDGLPYTLPESRADDELRLNYDFIHEFTESGFYTVSVTAYDNAGNESLPSEPRSFNVDGVGPAIHITPENYDDDWSTEKTITFTITDAGSGIYSWTLTGPDGQSYPYTPVEGEENTYTFTVTKKGTYTISAYDYAGNNSERELTFTKVSSEVPDTPVVSTDIMEQESGWFTANPTITISKQIATPDGTEVITYYRIWKDGEAEPKQSQIVSESFQLPGEGIYNIRVWAESLSGMQSAEKPLYQLGYDGKKPVIHDLVVTGKGTINQVTFRVTEETSGLANLEAIYEYNEAYTQRLIFREISKGLYAASFTAAMTGSYQIRATDAAGNVSYADAFRPMNVIVTNVSGSSENGITIIGQVIAGSFEIASVEVKYGSFGMGSGYSAEDLIVITDEVGNKAITARLTNVTEDTTYQFRIIATATTGEVCEYSGSFRTGIRGGSGANVVGTVVDDTMQRALVPNISVMLYNSDGDIVQSRNDMASGDYFMFTEVPDGIYTIRATNGNSSVTQGVIIENGIVVAPEGQLKLVLRSGQRTNVESKDGNSLHYVVSGLGDLFDDTTNFGDEDQKVIDNGGTIEFCMVIDELDESEVPESDRMLIAQNLGRQERVLLYVDFSIWKRASFAYGIISETPVTAIAGGKSIQIVIPLVADWVGLKNLSVIRVHGNSVDRLSDLDDNPNTYTISSTLFSTYALVYTDETISTEDPNNPGGTGNGSQNPNGGNGGASGSTSDLSKTPNNGSNLTSNGSGSTPRTGDEAPILWVSILGLAAGILGSLQLRRKK